MIKPKGDYIGGRFVKPRHPDQELPSVDPGDGEMIIGDFPIHHAAAEEALAAARSAFPAWAALSAEDRLAALRKLRAELRNRTDDLVSILSSETGRPQWETREDVLSMHGDIDALLTRSMAELSLCGHPPGHSRVRFEPLGVAVVLSPYPQAALLMHLDAVTAMAAGCAVVCKPSGHTPATGQLYADIVHEADLPRGVFNLVQGDRDVGATLAQSLEADVVLFSGGTGSGRALTRQLMGLEGKVLRTLCSGNAAALVLDDAHLDHAAYNIVIGGCLTAGQRCTSTRRVLVQRRAAEPLAEQLVRLLSSLKVGYSADPSIFMGPLMSAPTRTRFLDELKQRGAEGAEELVQGAPLSSRRRGFYVSPALHRVDAEGMRAIAEREVIGPLLALSVVSDLEEAVELANASPFGLVLSVFCRSERSFDRVRQLQTAGLCLRNHPTTHAPPALPFHPAGRSGNGQPVGVLTARVCTRAVTTLETDPALDVTMLPPGLPRE